MSIRERKDRRSFLVDLRWPDGERTRTAVESLNKGEELELRAQLAVVDGTWPEFREAVVTKKAATPAEAAFDPPTKIGELCDRYLELYVQTKNRSVRTKRNFLRTFKERWENVRIVAFSLARVDAYVSERLRTGVKNATVNREVACLRHMFSWAKKRGWANLNPLSDWERLAEAPWMAPEVTRPMAEKVLKGLDERFLPVFTFIGETGARRHEARFLERSLVDRERRLASFVYTKTGKIRHVPLTARALEAIDSVPELPGCPHVFCDPKRRQPWSDPILRFAWEDARRAAGYDWMRVRDLRIAFGTELVERGLDSETACKVVGNTKAVFDRYYNKAKDAPARRALKVLEGGRKR